MYEMLSKGNFNFNVKGLFLITQPTSLKIVFSLYTYDLIYQETHIKA